MDESKINGGNFSNAIFSLLKSSTLTAQEIAIKQKINEEKTRKFEVLLANMIENTLPLPPKDWHLKPTSIQ